jgi:hypothetical protein
LANPDLQIAFFEKRIGLAVEIDDVAVGLGAESICLPFEAVQGFSRQKCLDRDEIDLQADRSGDRAEDRVSVGPVRQTAFAGTGTRIDQG